MFSPEDFRLSFSTWSAPDQSVPQLIELASSNGYSGIELRMSGNGVEHAHGVGLDTSKANLKEIQGALASSGIEISCLATPLAFGGLTDADLPQAIEDLNRYVSLAQELGARTVRCFGGRLDPSAGEYAGLVDQVADAFSESVAFAEETNVSVLLETFGDFANSKFAREVLKQVYSDSFGILWDVAHPYRALATVEETYDNLSEQVKHVHLHDYRYVDGRLKIQAVPLGEGRVPIKQAIACLAHEGFEGYLSVETREGPADEVLEQHAKYIRGVLNETFEAAQASAEK